MLRSTVRIIGWSLWICVWATAIIARTNSELPFGFPLPDASYASTVPTPDQVLGFALGTRPITPEEAVRYLRAVAAASDRVHLETYGHTVEERPLILVWISTPEHLRQRASYAAQWRALWDPADHPDDVLQQWIREGLPVLVWFAYSVHGNEHSSTEAALALTYHLAASRSDDVARVLSQTVVILDPIQNPDGRARFVQWVRQHLGQRPDANPFAIEHREAWPGGRYNHYLYDLNRDWLFQTQQETRAKVAAYFRHPPQVFVDFHEMGWDETYFFPPPTLPVIPWLPRDLHHKWWTRIGQANARAFEQRGWRYFTREWFDIYYPGYGDSFPSLNGAIGMTYEQASARGVIVQRTDGTLLTLGEAIHHHFVTGWTTLHTVASHRAELLNDFLAYRRAAIARESDIDGWIVPADNDPFLREHLYRKLTRIGVRLYTLPEGIRMRVRWLPDGAETPYRSHAGDWWIPVRQAQRYLLRVWLDPEVPMDPEFLRRVQEARELRERPGFYDITGWSLAPAWQMRIGAVRKAPEHVSRTPAQPVMSASETNGTPDYAVIVCNRTLAAFRIAGDALQHGYRFYINRKPIGARNTTCPPGSLIFFVRQQDRSFADWLRRWQERYGSAIFTLDSGWPARGISLGSPNVDYVNGQKRVVLVEGPGSIPTSVGALWHTLEVTYGWPLTRVSTAYLDTIDLGRVGVLILADVDLSMWNARRIDPWVERLKQWLRAGGTLVTIGHSIRWAADKGLLKVEWGPGPATEASNGKTRRRRVPGIPGSLLWTTVERRHFWTGGYPDDRLAVLYYGRTIARPDPERAFVVVRFATADRLKASGFVWDDFRKDIAETAYAWMETHGRGKVFAILTHPMFRGDFWGTHRLLLSAVLWGLASGG